MTHTLFTEGERERLRARLLDRARDDPRISGAAITGSTAGGKADRWSDIDLFFGVASPHAPLDVLVDWSRFVYDDLGALHHFDLQAGPATYRAFLLPDCLEVDLAFTPDSSFSATSTTFQVVFGEAVERPAAAPSRDHLIGLAWHHVLHGRISIERGKTWQAEYWISALRDHTLELVCLRLGLPAAHAKGVDALPAELLKPYEATLVGNLDPDELWRALGVATDLLLAEAREVDMGLAARLAEPLRALTPRSPHGSDSGAALRSESSDAEVPPTLLR